MVSERCYVPKTAQPFNWSSFVLLELMWQWFLLTKPLTCTQYISMRITHNREIRQDIVYEEVYKYDANIWACEENMWNIHKIMNGENKWEINWSQP